MCFNVDCAHRLCRCVARVQRCRDCEPAAEGRAGWRGRLRHTPRAGRHPRTALACSTLPGKVCGGEDRSRCGGAIHRWNQSVFPANPTQIYRTTAHLRTSVRCAPFANCNPSPTALFHHLRSVHDAATTHSLQASTPVKLNAPVLRPSNVISSR